MLNRRIAVCAVFCNMFLSLCFAQTEKPVLEFYGTISASSDKEMIKLTQDLFFTQLTELDSFTIIDKRGELFPETGTQQEKSDYVFFAEIYELPDGGWQCVLNIIHPETNKKYTNTKNYESYYKILIESKSAFNSLLSNMFPQAAPPVSPAPLTAAGGKITSLETLAGTWKGEPYIDKIMILKGSRGFVIYKNGATMNISLSINNSTITAVQTSKPNASFFPELPREQALLAAQNAPPIEWVFSVNSDGTVLTGEKKMLSTVSPVTWTKQ